MLVSQEYKHLTITLKYSIKTNQKQMPIDIYFSPFDSRQLMRNTTLSDQDPELIYLKSDSQKL